MQLKGLIYKTTLFANEIMKEPTAEFGAKEFDSILACIKEEAAETDTDVAAYRALPQDADAQTRQAATEKALDGFLDTIYTSIAGAYVFLRTLGHTHDSATELVAQCYDRVCNANLSKRLPDGTVIRDDSGKVQKPAGFQAPVFSDLITLPPTMPRAGEMLNQASNEA